MFGMGFFEILLIVIIGIIVLGPEKLPKAIIEITKFINKLRTSVEEVKTTLDNELNISKMKEEANEIKAQIEDAKSLASIKDINLGLNDTKDDMNEKNDKKEIVLDENIDDNFKKSK